MKWKEPRFKLSDVAEVVIEIGGRQLIIYKDLSWQAETFLMSSFIQGTHFFHRIKWISVDTVPRSGSPGQPNSRQLAYSHLYIRWITGIYRYNEGFGKAWDSYVYFHPFGALTNKVEGLLPTTLEVIIFNLPFI
jgi:hypothetical protein